MQGTALLPMDLWKTPTFLLDMIRKLNMAKNGERRATLVSASSLNVSPVSL